MYTQLHAAALMEHHVMPPHPQYLMTTMMMSSRRRLVLPDCQKRQHKAAPTHQCQHSSQLSTRHEALALPVVCLEAFHEVGKGTGVSFLAHYLIDGEDLLESKLFLTYSRCKRQSTR